MRKDSKMKSLREQLTGVCKHAAPRMLRDRDECCKAGVNYHALARIDELGRTGCALRFPCGGEKPGTETRGNVVEKCDKYEPLTPEEIDAEIAEHDREIACLLRGVSRCCEAPIDERAVILDGEHKGHGPRFCSKCGNVVFMV